MTVSEGCFQSFKNQQQRDKKKNKCYENDEFSFVEKAECDGYFSMYQHMVQKIEGYYKVKTKIAGVINGLLT